MPLQYFQRLVHGVAFADGPQIEAHARHQQLHRPVFGVEAEVAVPNCLPGFRQCLCGGQLQLPP